MQHLCEESEMHTKFLSEVLKRTDMLGDLHVD
jgi:hypothetical protein